MRNSTCIQKTILREVRVGKRSSLGTSGLISAVNKTPVHGAVEVKGSAIAGDEYGAPEVHGGPEQVIMQYPEQHYEHWRQEFPNRADRMSAGGFGENFVALGFDETNMCIGDVVTVGSARLQVSMPRQPCVRLNHRFDLPTMAFRVQQSRRTGWYYRVLTPGFVSANDIMDVVERPYPQWTLSKIQHYLYSEMNNVEAMEELSELDLLAPLMRELFAKRLASLKNENEVQEAYAGRNSWLKLRVEGVNQEATTVRSYLLSSLDGKPLPEPAPGAHIRVRLPDGLVRQYSLCPTKNSNHYRIGVGLAADSRGGSRWIHESLKQGDTIECSAPQDSFSIAPAASCHVMFAGGIGITPFLSMIAQFRKVGQSFHLYYMGRYRDACAFISELEELCGTNLTTNFTEGDASKRLDIHGILAALPPDAHVYCCGPDSMVETICSSSNGPPPENVHVEKFSAPPETSRSQAYSVFLAKRSIWIEAEPGKSLLASLRKQRVEVMSSCETGSCGSCVVNYSEGGVEHRDSCLSEHERRSCLTVCVSYANSTSITLDL